MTISPVQNDWVPSACTLPTVEQPIRVAEFDRFFADAVRAVRRPHPHRLELILASGAEPRARDLAARETGCCSFFVFDFDATEQGTVLSIGVPPAYTAVLDAIAARATGGAR
ncbi:hypothetical protein [Nocardia cerradoensis]|uniref:hypothetical protein n=1 Tax=Nocardia cerradoensis TaxID=85688 RepID=UPI0002EDAEDB|nr:hypothetical protein [Nocardia cerradoensis]NKY43405.1 hypothetical protein [Nocardia cerradoensis]